MINSTPAISCSLAPAASATPGGHGLGIQGRYRGRAKPEPGLVLDEVFVCERQPAQGLLGCH
jgi:hypothetical protein